MPTRRCSCRGSQHGGACQPGPGATANTVTLHTDSRQLLPDPKLWSSWNFVREPPHGHTSGIREGVYEPLQNLRTWRNYIVTLNSTRPFNEGCVLNSTQLTHPLFSFESMATQPRLKAMNGQRGTWFCGSYFGYGFHEDAVRSAVEVAQGFGIELGSAKPPATAAPAHAHSTL